MPPPRAVVCKICGGKFMKHSYPIHLPRCQKKWDMSHTECKTCGRSINNSDWALHKADCKPVPGLKRRKKQSRLLQNRGGSSSMSQPSIEDQVVGAKSIGRPDGKCEECEDVEAVLKCNQCEQALCQACSDSIHKKGARARHMREPLLAGGAPPPEQEDFREPCRICGRKFGRDRVYIHERICQKNKNKAKKKKLKVKTGAELRVKGTEFEEFLKRPPKTPPEIKEWREQGGRRWRDEAAGFRDIIETNKALGAMGSVGQTLSVINTADNSQMSIPLPASGPKEEMKRSGPPPVARSAKPQRKPKDKAPKKPKSAKAKAKRESKPPVAAQTPAPRADPKKQVPPEKPPKAVPIKRREVLDVTPDAQALKSVLDQKTAARSPSKSSSKSTQRRQSASRSSAAAASTKPSSTAAPRRQGGARAPPARARVPSADRRRGAPPEPRPARRRSASRQAAARRMSAGRKPQTSVPPTGSGRPRARSKGRTSAIATEPPANRRSRARASSTSAAARAAGRRGRSSGSKGGGGGVQLIGRIGKRVQARDKFAKGDGGLGRSYTTGSMKIRSQYSDRSKARERGAAALKALKKTNNPRKQQKAAARIARSRSLTAAVARQPSGAVRTANKSRDAMLQARQKLAQRAKVPGGSTSKPAPASSAAPAAAAPRRNSGSAGRQRTRPQSPFAAAGSSILSAQASSLRDQVGSARRIVSEPPSVPTSSSTSSLPASSTLVNRVGGGTPTGAVSASMAAYLEREKARRAARRSSGKTAPAGSGRRASRGAADSSTRRIRTQPQARDTKQRNVRTAQQASKPADAAPVPPPQVVDAPMPAVSTAPKGGGAAFTVPAHAPSKKSQFKAMPLLSTSNYGSHKDKPSTKVGTGFILSGPKGRAPVTRNMKARMVGGKVERVLTHKTDAAGSAGDVRDKRAQFYQQ